MAAGQTVVLVAAGGFLAPARSLFLLLAVVAVAVWSARCRRLMSESAYRYRVKPEGLERISPDGNSSLIPLATLAPRDWGRIGWPGGQLHWMLLSEAARFIVALSRDVLESDAEEGSVGGENWPGWMALATHPMQAFSWLGTAGITALALAAFLWRGTRGLQVAALGYLVVPLLFLGVSAIVYVGARPMFRFSPEGIDVNGAHRSWADVRPPEWPRSLTPTMPIDLRLYWRFWLGYCGGWMKSR